MTATVLRALAAVVVLQFLGHRVLGGWVPWERAIPKYGHQGQNMQECRAGCILPAVWTHDTQLIVVTVEGSNLGLKDSIPVLEYVAANSSKPHPKHKCACRQGKTWPYIYKPWARESSLFIRFITEYYDKLPRHVLFAHGQHRSWHQSLSILSFVESAVERMGQNAGDEDVLMSPDKIACHTFTTYCKQPLSSTGKRFWDAYDNIIPGVVEGMKPHNEYPQCLALSFRGRPCCGEFLVSRSVVHRRPHETYKLLYTRGADYTAPKSSDNTYLARLHANLDARFAGHVMEYLWSFIFARNPSTEAAGGLDIPDDDSRCSNYHKDHKAGGRNTGGRM